jgi:hypothetical protein
MATIEIMLPKYLAEWIEKQAIGEKRSAGALVKLWLIKLHGQAAQKASR